MSVKITYDSETTAAGLDFYTAIVGAVTKCVEAVNRTGNDAKITLRLTRKEAELVEVTSSVSGSAFVLAKIRGASEQAELLGDYNLHNG